MRPGAVATLVLGFQDLGLESALLGAAGQRPEQPQPRKRKKPDSPDPGWKTPQEIAELRRPVGNHPGAQDAERANVEPEQALGPPPQPCRLTSEGTGTPGAVVFVAFRQAGAHLAAC